MGSSIHHIEARAGRHAIGRRTSKENINKINESWMKVARALSSQRKENIVRIQMVLGVVRMLDIASHLGSLRVSCLVRQARRRKDEVSKQGALGGRIKRDQNVRALARGRKCWASVIWSLMFKNRGSRVFQRIPMMNVSRGLGCLV